MGRHSSANHHSPSSRRHRSISPPPPRDKHRHSARSSEKPVRPDSGSPDHPPPRSRSRSPSPRTKRLKRVQSEREREREGERSHGSGGGGREKGSERDAAERKKEKREAENDGGGRNGRSSRSRHEMSPERDRNGRRRHRSQSSPERERNGRSRNRSQSPPERVRNGRNRHPSQSPQAQHRRHDSAAAHAKPRDEATNSRGDEQMNDEDDSISKMKAAEEALEEKQKQKPSFELSGKLAAETNRVRGVTLLFNEPAEARKPDVKWRLYVFKGGEVLNEPLYIHRQSCYLFGRERRVADIPTDHPSCSKQHAVIQFRQVETEQADGTISKKIRPYIMDLGSTNKTFVNENPIEPECYYELREQDTIKFGNSSREYVLLHENSAG